MKFISLQQIRSSIPKGPSIIPTYNPSGIPIGNMVFENTSGEKIQTPEIDFKKNNNNQVIVLVSSSGDVASFSFRVRNEGLGPFSYSGLSLTTNSNESEPLLNLQITTRFNTAVGNFSTTPKLVLPPNTFMDIRISCVPDYLIANPCTFNVKFLNSKNNTRIPFEVNNIQTNYNII